MKQTALWVSIVSILLTACSASGGNAPSATTTIVLLPTLEVTATPPPDSSPIAPATAAPPAAPSSVSGVATDMLNVRAGPGLDYAVKSQLKEGDKITLTGKSADGLWLQFSGGWVSATYVRVSGDATNLPVATPGPLN